MAVNFVGKTAQIERFREFNPVFGTSFFLKFFFFLFLFFFFFFLFDPSMKWELGGGK